MTISAREKRFLAVGGLAVLLFLLIQGVVKPAIQRQREVRRAIGERQGLLEQYEQLAQGKRRYEERLGELEAAYTQMQRRLFTVETPAVAGARLQALLQQLAKASDVEVRTVRFLQPKRAGTFTQISVELNFGATLKSLIEFLYQIEAHERLLLIPRMTIRAGRGPLIQVTLEVAGFIPFKEEKGKAAQA